MADKKMVAANAYKIVDGKAVKQHKECPKCPGKNLAKHKDRLTCGSCDYMEIVKSE